MPSSNRSLLLSCAVLLISACLCLSLLSMGGAGIWFWQQSQPLAPGGTQAPSDLPTAPPGQGNLQTPPIPWQSEIPVEVAEQMDSIEANISQIRGLQTGQPIPRYLLNQSQLQEHVLNVFLADYSPADARQDALVLSSLGLLDPDFKLYDFYIELYNEQVAGYYDLEEDAMYIIQEESFGGLERFSYAHEFTHALQDVNFGIREELRYTEEDCKNESERCAGILALMEGDASLAQQLWFFTYSTDTDKRQIQEYYQVYQSPVLDGAPYFFMQDFLFPYQSGLEFVQSLYDRGGWAAVNAAYHNPPVSTRQILHPDAYPDEVPSPVASVDLGSLLDASWEEIRSDQLGEWSTYLVLTAGVDAGTRLSENLGRLAAAGWKGDSLQIYLRPADEAVALVLVTDWDSSREAIEFGEAFTRYGSARWGQPIQDQGDRLHWETDSEKVIFQRQGSQTTWLLAPDSAALNQLSHGIFPGD